MHNFFSASPEFILLQMAALAAQRYQDERIPHYARHGIERPPDELDAGSLVWITQDEAMNLLRWVKKHSPEGLPEELCPFLSELKDMCDPDRTAYIKHVGFTGDPDLN